MANVPELDGALELVRVVRLDEQVEPERPAAREHEARLLVVQVAQEQQRRVRARDPALEQVALVAEEALGEERQRGRGPRALQVGE